MYSLSYRFDSVSPAGKFCGTALDLIKRYNELAKEAHASGDYVEMEVFRQYAEHYRKIVTDINERKSTHAENEAQPVQAETAEPETDAAPSTEVSAETPEVISQAPLCLKKKTLKIVEISESADNIKTEDAKPKRASCRKPKEPATREASAVI